MTLQRTLFVAVCGPLFLTLSACEPTAQNKGEGKSEFKDDSEAEFIVSSAGKDGAGCRLIAGRPRR